MSRTTFCVTFYIRKTRLNKQGLAPIYLKVTVDNETSACPIPLKVAPQVWNPTQAISMGSEMADFELNQHLNVIKVRLMQIHREMELEGKSSGCCTAKAVLDRYLGRDKPPTIYLIKDVFKVHNDRCHKLMGRDMAAGTVERYETSLKHTVEFMENTMNVSDIPIEEVTHKFIKDYEFYLKSERQCSHNTTTKYLKNFKKIIRIALANDYIQKDPFANIKFSLDKVERDFLSEAELKVLSEKYFPVERLAQIRDIFLFACFTGLAFSDLSGLSREHIVMDNSERMWIRKKRQKTDVMCNIPLLDVALRIMEKCHDPQSERVLPVISNTKMNAYLKEIMDVCGIQKSVSTHTARHTFATYMLSKGALIENVAKMLGHTDTKMTRHYAKILDESIMSDMLNIEEKIRFTLGQ